MSRLSFALVLVIGLLAGALGSFLLRPAATLSDADIRGIVTDALKQTGDFAEGTSLPTQGHYDVTEFYGELSIPLLRDVAFVEDLSVAQRQLVEIAKAFHHNAKVLILDEPTSALSQLEVEHLFAVIQRMR